MSLLDIIMIQITLKYVPGTMPIFFNIQGGSPKEMKFLGQNITFFYVEITFG